MVIITTENYPPIALAMIKGKPEKVLDARDCEKFGHDARKFFDFEEYQTFDRYSSETLYMPLQRKAFSREEHLFVKINPETLGSS